MGALQYHNPVPVQLCVSWKSPSLALIRLRLAMVPLYRGRATEVLEVWMVVKYLFLGVKYGS